jgi:hypothetical protein
MGGGGPNPLTLALGALQNKSAAPGASLSQQSAELQGSDPTMVLRQLEQVNQVLGVLFIKTFQTLPNVANQISATMKQLSRALKEAQQGSSVSEVVGKNEENAGPQPVSFGPAMFGQNSQPNTNAAPPM